MINHTPRWSHPPGNAVVPSPWQATLVACVKASTYDLEETASRAQWGRSSRCGMASGWGTELGRPRISCGTSTAAQLRLGD